MNKNYFLFMICLAFVLMADSLEAQLQLDVAGDAKIQGTLEIVKGSNNTFVGENAGGAYTSGFGNTYFGNRAGSLTSTGLNNTFLGKNAGLKNTANNNTFVGKDAGNNTTTGNNNVFMGPDAGTTNVSGSGNTFLGIEAKGSANNISRSIAIGQNAIVDCSNCAVIGGTGANAVNVGIGTTTPSTKLDVNGSTKTSGHIRISDSDTEVGLTTEAGGGIFNMDYNFRHTNVDISQIGAAFRIDSRINDPLFNWIRRSAGVSGSETLMVLNKEGDLGVGIRVPTARLDVDGTVRVRNLPNGSGSVVVADADGNLFREAVAPNLNSEVIEQLQRENEILKTRLAQLEEIVQSMVTKTVHQSQMTLIPTTAELQQNQPNPFNGQTTIQYFLPEATQNAHIQITDINGAVLKVETINEKGHGQLNLDAKALPQGTYAYSLLVDGQLVETKRMILVK